MVNASLNNDISNSDYGEPGYYIWTDNKTSGDPYNGDWYVNEKGKWYRDTDYIPVYQQPKYNLDDIKKLRDHFDNIRKRNKLDSYSENKEIRIDLNKSICFILNEQRLDLCGLSFKALNYELLKYSIKSLDYHFSLIRSVNLKCDITDNQASFYVFSQNQIFDILLNMVNCVDEADVFLFVITTAVLPVIFEVC